jgi:hypothetical protein
MGGENISSIEVEDALYMLASSEQVMARRTTSPTSRRLLPLAKNVEWFSSEAVMANPTGESVSDAVRLDFDGRHQCLGDIIFRRA